MIVRKKLKLVFEKAPILILISAAIVFSGCTRTADPEIAKTINVNQATIAVNNTNSSSSSANLTPPPQSNGNTFAASPPVADASTPPSAGSSPVVIDKSKKTATSAPAPTPNVGSGGEDLFLFTQVRGALSSDKELANGVIVEIKQGEATLNGKVSSEEQKKKAQQIIQNVKGIKSVKNNLRVSS